MSEVNGTPPIFDPSLPVTPVGPGGVAAAAEPTADDLMEEISAIMAAQGVEVQEPAPTNDPMADAAAAANATGATTPPAPVPPAPAAPYQDAPLPPVDPAAAPAPVDPTRVSGIPAATPEQIAAEIQADPNAPTAPPDPTANLVDLGNGVVADRDEAARIIEWAKSLQPHEVAAIERTLANPTAASGSGTPAPVYTQPGPGVPPSPYYPQGYGYPAPVGQPGAPIYPPAAPQPGQMPQPYPQPIAQPYPAPVAPQPGYPPTPQGYPQQPVPGQMPAFDPAAVVGPLAELAPELANYLAAQQQQTAILQQQLAANTAYQQQQLQQQARQEEETRNAGLNAGRDQFLSEHPDLSDVDMHYLTSRVAASQSIAGLVRQHNGNYQAAMNDAFTTAMYSDPAYRNRVLQAAVEQQASTSQQIQERAASAAALTGSRGAIPQTQQPNPTTLPPTQRKQALTSDIASFLATANG